MAPDPHLGPYGQKFKASLSEKGALHPDTLMFQRVYAEELIASGQVEEGIGQHRFFYQGCVAVFGEDHVLTLEARHVFAWRLGESGRLEDAIGHSQGAVNGRSKVLGPDNPDTVGSRNNHATLLFWAGRFDEAIDHLQQALGGQLRTAGERDEGTLNVRANLGLFLQEAGRHAEAVEEYRLAWAGRSEALGADHPDTQGSLFRLALGLAQVGEFEEAIGRFRSYRDAQERKSDFDHQEFLLAGSHVAACLLSAGRHAEAVHEFRDILTAEMRTLGEDEPSTLKTRNNLAVALRSTGELGEALDHFRQVVHGFGRVHGSLSPEAVSARGTYAECLAESGDTSEAIEQLGKVLVLLDSITAGPRQSEYPDTQVVSERLQALKKGDPSDSEASEVSSEKPKAPESKFEQLKALASIADTPELAFYAYDEIKDHLMGGGKPPFSKEEIAELVKLRDETFNSELCQEWLANKQEQRASAQSFSDALAAERIQESEEKLEGLKEDLIAGADDPEGMRWLLELPQEEQDSAMEQLREQYERFVEDPQEFLEGQRAELVERKAELEAELAVSKAAAEESRQKLEESRQKLAAASDAKAAAAVEVARSRAALEEARRREPTSSDSKEGAARLHEAPVWADDEHPEEPVAEDTYGSETDRVVQEPPGSNASRKADDEAFDKAVSRYPDQIVVRGDGGAVVVPGWMDELEMGRRMARGDYVKLDHNHEPLPSGTYGPALDRQAGNLQPTSKNQPLAPKSRTHSMNSAPSCCSMAYRYGRVGREVLGDSFSRTIKNRTAKKTLKKHSVKKGSLRITDFGYSILKAIEVLDHVLQNPAFHASTFGCDDDMLLETVLHATGESYLPQKLPWADSGHIDATVRYVLDVYTDLRLQPKPSESVSLFGSHGFGLPMNDLEAHVLLVMVESSIAIMISAFEEDGNAFLLNSP